jgi:hypothetical protein
VLLARAADPQQASRRLAGVAGALIVLVAVFASLAALVPLLIAGRWSCPRW